MVELDSSKVQVILPPLSEADDELQDKETVGVVDLPSRQCQRLSLPTTFSGISH